MEWKLLAALSEGDRRRLLASATRRRFAGNEIIFHEGDPGDTLHLVESGHVAIRTSTPIGDVATLAILQPGDAFGEQVFLYAESRRTASALSLEATNTLTISRVYFEELRRTHPSVDRFLVDLLAEQVRKLSAQVVEAHYLPANKRLLRRLCELVEMYGTEGSSGTVIPLNQEIIASLAGMTRPTANRVLRELEGAGIVAITRGHIEVTNTHELGRRAR